MESVLVSIIVPIYNVEPYLERCIKSLVVQTHENLEIILINDGSTDDSLKHCLDWRIKDNRIIVVDKANAGQGPARNLGCQIARGEYITFVDSDDWLEDSFIELMLQKISQEDAQVAFCDYNQAFPDGTRKPISLECYLEQAVNPQEEPSIINQSGLCYWNKLFKKELLKQVHIDQPPHTWEDLCTLFIILAHAQKVVQLRKALYNYSVRKSSSSYQINYMKHYVTSLNTAKANCIKYKIDNKIWYYVGKNFHASLVFNQRLNNKNCEFLKNLSNMEQQFYHMFMESRNPGSMNYLVFGSYNLKCIVNRIVFKPFQYFGFSSIISMMSDGLTGEYQVVNENKMRQDSIQKDITSSGNKILQEEDSSIDYIFIDFLEERFDVLEMGQGCFVTKSDAFEEGEIGEGFRENLCNIIHSGSQEFIQLWQSACLKMICLLKQKFLPRQIVLVKSRLATIYGTGDDKKEYKNRNEIIMTNEFIQQLEDFFISKFPGIQILELKQKELLYTDNQFQYGVFPWHMNHYAYTSLTNDACKGLK